LGALSLGGVHFMRPRPLLLYVSLQLRSPLTPSAMEDAPVKISEYRIISATNADDLEQQVQQLLRSGWHLFGQLVANDLDFAREMVRYGHCPSEEPEEH